MTGATTTLTRTAHPMAEARGLRAAFGSLAAGRTSWTRLPTPTSRRFASSTRIFGRVFGPGRRQHSRIAIAQRSAWEHCRVCQTISRSSSARRLPALGALQRGDQPVDLASGVQVAEGGDGALAGLARFVAKGLHELGVATPASGGVYCPGEFLLRC